MFITDIYHQSIVLLVITCW